MSEPASSTSSARRGVTPWLIAIAVVAAAVAVRGLMAPWVGDRLPFITMFGAVAAAAWWGGTGPALLAAVIGFGASTLLYRGAEWLSLPWAPEQWLTLGGYAFSAGVIVLFGHALHRARSLAEGETRRCLVAEADARAGRRRLEVTLKSIGDGVLVCDTEGRVQSLNPVAQQLTGWNEDDARGRSLREVFDIVNETTGETVENPALRALAEGAIVGLANHTVLRPRVGAAVPIEDSAAPIIGEDDKTIGAVLVFRDARAQRENEQRLVQAHEALYVVMQALPLAVVVLDVGSRRVRLWNEAAERLFGRAATEAMGQPFALAPPDRAEAQARQLARVEAGELLQDVPITLLHADGRAVPLRLSAAPVLDAAGQVTGSLLLLADLSERLRIEASLRRSDATLRAFFDNAPAGLGVVELTDDDDILHLQDNPVTCALFGVAPGGTAQRRASALGASAEMISHWLLHYRQSDALNRPVSFEYAQELRGEALRFRATVCRIGEPAQDGGAPARYCYVVEDITQRKQAEEALARADRRKDEFIATLAHELRNPLAPLRNGVHLLRILLGRNGIDGQPGAAAKPLAIMERQIGHMVRLIDDLLDVARVSGDKLELQRHRMDIADAVRDAVETSQSLIHEARHGLTVMLPTQPVFVDADATRLCQVITNLLNNAAKYTSEGGHIRLSVEPREPGWVEVCVEDDGRGLAPEMLPQIFQMFTQVDRQAGRSGGGLGIGLAIARKLTQMHGGELRAASRGLGLGSSFVVRLPRLRDDPGAAMPAGGYDMQVLVADRQGQLRAGCRVLIADDNADAADSLNTLLRLMGCETWVAHDGVEALRLAEAMRPDIALLDIGMPGLDGHQLARQIRAQPWGRAIKLVAVTGWGQASDQQASADAGFDLHWVKPVDPAALDALIESLSAARAAAADSAPPGG